MPGPYQDKIDKHILKPGKVYRYHEQSSENARIVILYQASFDGSMETYFAAVKAENNVVITLTTGDLVFVTKACAAEWASGKDGDILFSFYLIDRNGNHGWLWWACFYENAWQKLSDSFEEVSP